MSSASTSMTALGKPSVNIVLNEYGRATGRTIEMRKTSIFARKEEEATGREGSKAITRGGCA